MKPPGEPPWASGEPQRLHQPCRCWREPAGQARRGRAGQSLSALRCSGGLGAGTAVSTLDWRGGGSVEETRSAAQTLEASPSETEINYTSGRKGSQR